MRESAYQSRLIKRLKKLFPDCIVIKNDACYIQGIPDLIILYGPYWAALEVKISEDAPFQPNQEHYLRMMSEMSYSAVIYPENELAVIDELQYTFGVRR